MIPFRLFRSSLHRRAAEFAVRLNCRPRHLIVILRVVRGESRGFYAHNARSAAQVALIHAHGSNQASPPNNNDRPELGGRSLAVILSRPRRRRGPVGSPARFFRGDSRARTLAENLDQAGDGATFLSFSPFFAENPGTPPHGNRTERRGEITWTWLGMTNRHRAKAGRDRLTRAILRIILTIAWYLPTQPVVSTGQRPGPGRRLDISQVSTSGSMILCQCAGVTEDQIEQAIRDGASTLAATVRSTRAGRFCRPCRTEICAILDRVLCEAERDAGREQYARLSDAGMEVTA